MEEVIINSHLGETAGQQACQTQNDDDNNEIFVAHSQEVEGGGSQKRTDKGPTSAEPAEQGPIANHDEYKSSQDWDVHPVALLMNKKYDNVTSKASLAKGGALSGAHAPSELHQRCGGRRRRAPQPLAEGICVLGVLQVQCEGVVCDVDVRIAARP